MVQGIAEQVVYSTKIQAMDDQQFVKEWHDAIEKQDDQRLAVIESAATHRFGIAAWQDRYVAQYPSQTLLPAPDT